MSFEWLQKFLLRVLLLLTVSFAANAQQARSDYQFKLDPKNTQQTFEGWGMSLSWYGNVIYPGNGKVDDWATWNTLLETIYGSQGLGFNIVRYNIGGGENPKFQYLFDYNKPFMIDGFLSPTGQWNWNVDQGQILMLQKAKALGANIFEAFSNSPPYFMLKSESVTGAPYKNDHQDGESGAWDNLRDDQYVNFANYMADVVLYFRDHYGIEFRTMDPVNEPRPVTQYWTFKQGYPKDKVQEGCHFSVSNQDRILLESAKALRARGLATQISGSDDTGIDLTRTSYLGYSMATRSVIAQINTHSYIGGDRTALKDLAKREGKRLWMSEYGSQALGMIGALELAEHIRADIKVLGAEAWNIWQPDWGLMTLDGHNKFTYVKEYWMMKQYSHFIRPGAVILNNADWGTLAAFNPNLHNVVMVTLNATSSATSTMDADLSAFGSLAASAQVYYTDSQHDMVQRLDVPVVGQHIRYQVTPGSVTTVVVQLL